MGGAISGTGGAISGILGGIGANKAAKQQESAQQQAMQQTQQGYNSAVGWMQPYETAGNSALSGLTSLAGKPLDRADLLNNYYNSREFSDLSQQARGQQLAAAEATGGLGSSATNNALASIAPALGQNYLADMTDQQQTMYNQLLGLSNMGAQSANALGNYAVGQGNTMAGLTQQLGQIKAGKAALPWQVAASANNSMAQGASQDVNKFTGIFANMFGGGGF